MDKKNYRVVNLRYTCEGLKFDAAIDCDWFLHAYTQVWEARNAATPIEIYCADHPEWDILMIYYKEEGRDISNYQQDDYRFGMLYNSLVSFDEIEKQTKAWIKENLKKKGK